MIQSLWNSFCFIYWQNFLIMLWWQRYFREGVACAGKPRNKSTYWPSGLACFKLRDSCIRTTAIHVSRFFVFWPLVWRVRLCLGYFFVTTQFLHPLWLFTLQAETIFILWRRSKWTGAFYFSLTASFWVPDWLWMLSLFLWQMAWMNRKCPGNACFASQAHLLPFRLSCPWPAGSVYTRS